MTKNPLILLLLLISGGLRSEFNKLISLKITTCINEQPDRPVKCQPDHFDGVKGLKLVRVLYATVYQSCALIGDLKMGHVFFRLTFACPPIWW